MNPLKQARNARRKRTLRTRTVAGPLSSVMRICRKRIVLQQFTTNFGGGGFRHGVDRGRSKLFDSSFETGKKGFARFTAFEMLFQFYTQRIVEFLVEVARELGKKSFTGRGPFFCRCRDLAGTEIGSLSRNAMVILTG